MKEFTNTIELFNKLRKIKQPNIYEIETIFLELKHDVLNS